MQRPYITSRWVEDGVSNYYYGPVSGTREIPKICMYPDAYLDYWSDVYVVQKLFERGVLLMTFLEHPREILEALEMVELQRMEPLLPQQEAVRRRLSQANIKLVGESCESSMAKIDGVVLRDQAMIKPIKHHAHRQSLRTHI